MPSRAPTAGLAFDVAAGLDKIRLERYTEARVVTEHNLDDNAWRQVGQGVRAELHRPSPPTPDGSSCLDPLMPLLRSVRDELHGIKQVIIAPHGPGHLIPWQVAADRAGWHPAISIATTPSITALARIRQRPLPETLDVVVVGDPKCDLHHAAQEARAVAEIYGVRALVGDEAADSAVRQTLSTAWLAHFATHAYFATGNPMDSGLALTDGVLSAREILTASGLSPSLVVISACESGVSDQLGGDEMAGLAQAFLFAGARTLVVSLWKVHDPATSVLMCELHQNLATGSNIASALRSGIDKVRARRRWEHPYFWGAFVLEGDPQFTRPP